MLNSLPRVLFALVLLLAVCNPVAAQQNPVAQGPLMGSGDSVNPGAAPLSQQSENINVLVIGDAMAGGMGAGLTRMANELPQVTVINRFKESSGLARSEVYDWPSALQKIMGANPVDVVVVMLGLNDRQEIREGNIRYVFRSPDWVNRYQQTADRLLDAAIAGKAKVLWVGLPPMAEAGFDSDMQFISGLLKARVEAKGAQFKDIRTFFSGPDGSYTDHAPDETGIDRRMRERDGVTFMRQGNNRLGKIVLQAVLDLRNGEPRSVAPSAAVPVAAVPQVPVEGVAVVTEAPSFGQEGLDGETLSFRADQVAVNAPRSSSLIKTPEAAGGKQGVYVKPVAKKGTMSERLLQQGEVAIAPVGRFDDYRVPPVQAAQ